MSELGRVIGGRSRDAGPGGNRRGAPPWAPGASGAPAPASRGPAEGSPRALVPVPSHMGIWDLHADRGTITFFEDNQRMARIELSERSAFDTIVSILREPHGMWPDPTGALLPPSRRHREEPAAGRWRAAGAGA